MNLIGKILTGLILVMSVGFFFISIMLGATHRNWKEAATQYKNEADQFQRVAEEAKSRGGQKDLVLARERVARQMHTAQLESRLRIAEENAREKERSWRAEQARSTEIGEALKLAERRLERKDEEVQNLKEDKRQLSADVADKFALVQNLTNRIYEISNELEELKKSNSDLSSTVAQKTRVMKAYGLSDTQTTDHIVPKVSGRVTRVGQDNKLIAIGLGSDDGLRVGHEMDVFRDDRYIGKVRITRTDYNVSVAEVIRELMQDIVREGDNVSSRL